MRDPHAPGLPPPRDWREAFATLPQAAPAADALAQVFAQLPASTPTRSGRQWWIAAAAVLALAAVVPLAMNVARHSGASQSRDAGIASARHSRESGKPAPVSVHVPDTAKPPLVADEPFAPATDSEKTLDTRPQGPREASRFRGNGGGRNSAPVRVAKAGRPHPQKHRSHAPSPTADPVDGAMEPLYAESARLEALLALARDDRATSATVVALGSDFEARVAAIDAALAQPSLTARRRFDLWRERVSALRAYASFESTQRALAASGERYDAMLVRID